MSAQTIQPLRFNQELRATFKLAGPLAIAQLAQIGMGVTDTVLLGALGGEAIAAGGLGAAIFFTSIMILQGVASSSGILIAHARGADALERIAPVFRAGLLIATFMLAPALLLLWNLEPLLAMINQPGDLAVNVSGYVRVLLAGAAALLWLANLRVYLASMNHPRMVMAVSFGGLIVNGFLNYGLIHGAFGLPEMGLIGSATATAITTWGMLIVTYAWIKLVPALSRYVTRGPIEWPLVRELLGLGWPIAVTIAVEALLFTAGALMMGTISVTALAAHQVTINVASLAFMVPMSIGHAANVRVGYYMGAKEPVLARQAGVAALVLGVGFMFFTAFIMFVAPHQIALLFSLDPADPKDAEVIALVVPLLMISAFFQIFDGAQTVAVGALRGLKDTRTSMILAGVSYWLIAFPIAWLMAFTWGLGPLGVWWGLAIGLLVAAVVLNARFVWLTNRLIGEKLAVA
ncbi:MAG: MATE family efflux transporter [Rhodospirillaceae bacterium]|nr:MATE family efflux transporter [Rhodospirillaceae bacterium]